MAENKKTSKLIKKILKREGYELVRNKNHSVYSHKLTNAKIYVSKSPTCATHEINLVRRQLRRFQNNIYHSHQKHLQNSQNLQSYK